MIDQLYIADLAVKPEEFILYLTNGDFAAGQREIPLVDIVIGRFSEGQEA